MELSTLDRLSEQNRRQRRRRILRLLFAAVMLFLFLGDRIVNGKRGEGYHQRLSKEFSEIVPFPNASVVTALDNYSPWNSHKGLVGADYRTSAQFADIREFYNHELESHGWRMVEDVPLKRWGKEVVGGRQLTYCKETLEAQLTYGSPNRYGWTYALHLTFGSPVCG